MAQTSDNFMFGDLFAALLQNGGLKNGDEFWDPVTWKHPGVSWQQVVGTIKEERQQMLQHNKVITKRGVYYNGILDEISQAALRALIPSSELEFIIMAYAERKEIIDLGIEQDCEDGEFDRAVRIIASIKRQCRKLREDDGNRRICEVVLGMYKERWFEKLDYRLYDYCRDRPDYQLNERGEERFKLRVSRSETEVKTHNERGTIG